MAATGIFARIMKALRRLPAAFREGYNKPSGVRPPDSLTRRREHPAGSPPPPGKDDPPRK